MAGRCRDKTSTSLLLIASNGDETWGRGRSFNAENDGPFGSNTRKLWPSRQMMNNGATLDPDRKRHEIYIVAAA